MNCHQTKTIWIILLSLFALSSNLFSQQSCEVYCAFTQSYINVCSDCGEAIAADDCADASIPSICNLDGFHFTTCGYTPDGPYGLPQFCGPSTIVHNNAWIGFTPAKSGRLHINVEVVYCEANDDNCKGLQAAVARALCRQPNNEFYGFGYESLDCVNCVDETFDLITTDAIEGVPHYIMIDGCCGDVCEIILHVIDGFPDRAWELTSENSLLCPSIASGDCYSAQSFASVTAIPKDGTLDAGEHLFEWYDQEGNLFYSAPGALDGEGGIVSIVNGINPDTNTPYFCNDGITSVTVEFFSKKTCCRENISFALEVNDPEPAEASFLDPNVTSLNCQDDQLIVKGNPVDPDVDVLFETWQKVSFDGTMSFQNIPVNEYNSNTSELSVFANQPNNSIERDPHTGAGTYLYTFIDRNSNCASEALICVPANTVAPVVNLRTPSVIDCGSNSTINLDASESEVYSIILDCDVDDIMAGIFPTEETVPTDNFTVYWSSPDGNPISNADQLVAQASLPGVYNCTIINQDNLCSATSSVTVFSAGGVPVIDLPQVADIGCRMSIDIDASVTGGNSGNLVYTWSNGNNIIGSGAQINVTEAGTYTVTVQDNATSCISTASIEVVATDDGGPRIEPMTSTDITCIASSSFLDPVITGDSDYSFSWIKDGNEIATTEDITVFEEGVYTLIVTDEITGCTTDQSTRIYLHQEIPVIIPFDDTVLNCDNDGITKVYATFDGIDLAYINAIEYEWFDSDGNLVGDYNFLEVTEGGEYTVKVVNRFNGCTAEETLQVTVDDDEPFVEPLISDPLNCIDQSITLNGKGNAGAAEARFEWLYEGEVISTSENVEVSEAGMYEFRVTNVQNGCARSETVIVDEDIDSPTADAGIQQELTCFNSSVVLDGSSSYGEGNLNYEWNSIYGTEIGSTITATQPGIYTLTIIDQANGCTATNSVEVIDNMNAPADVSASGGTLTCFDQTVALSANSNDTNVSYQWISPSNIVSNGAEINTSESGTYIIVATNLENGCTSETFYELEEDLTGPEGLTATNGQIDCINSETTLTASATTSDVSFEWISPGNVTSQGENLTTTSPGTYTVVATNLTTGCTSSTTAMVEADDDIPTLNLNYLDGTTSFLNCNTSSSILEGISDAGIEIQWEDPNNNIITDNPITVFDPGQYILTAINPQNLCETEIQINIVADFEEPEISASASHENLTCEISEIVLSATDVNGLSNDYEWIDANGNLITNAANGNIDQEGTYTVIATGENGCTTETTITIGENIQEPIISTAPDFTLSCNENTYQLDGDSDINSNVLYSWTGPDGFTSNEANPTIDRAGVYTFEVTDLTNMCSSTAEVTISEDVDVIDASIDGVAELNCMNTSLELLGSSDQDDVSYNWILPGQNQSTDQNIEINTPGEYILLVTDQSSGCTATETVIITSDFTTPVIDVVGGEIDCQSTSIGLQGTSDLNNVIFNWVGPNGFESTEEDPIVTEAGEYTLTVIADNGCSTSASAIVSQDENIPDLQIESDLGNIINCNTSALTLTGVSSVDGLDYSWTHEESGITNNGSVLNVTEAGNYTVMVIDPSNGCSEISTINIVADFEEPALTTITNTINCIESAVSLFVESTEAITAEWTGPSYISDALEASNVVEPGTYTVVITSADNGCTNTAIVEVEQDIEEPEVNVSSTLITCINQEVPLSGLGSSEGAEFIYAWEFDGEVISSDLNFSTDETGNYTLNITNTENGCSASESIFVDQNTTAPTAEAGETLTLTCSEESETLNGSASIGQGNLSYAWLNQLGAEISNEATFNTSETGTFTLIVTDLLNGCTSTDQVLIEQDVNAPSLIFAQAEEITCDRNVITLDASASSGQGTILYEWRNSNDEIVGTEQNIEVSEAGVYQLTVIDLANDCMTTSSIEALENINAPQAEILEPTIITCVDMTSEIILENVEASDPVYTWSGPDNFSSNDQNLEGIETSGSYSLTIMDQSNGCETTWTVEVFADNVLPTAEAEVTEELNCSITEITIDGSASSPSSTYFWSGPSIVSGENTLNPIVDAAGEYTLTVTNDVNGCQNEITVSVDMNDIMIEDLQVDASDVNCFGPNTGSIEILEVISGTAPFVYSIDGGNSFTQDVLFEDLGSGDYNVIVEDAIGCQMDLTIEIDPAIDLFLDYTSTAENNTIIGGQSVQLIPENNFEIDEIEWSEPDVAGLFPFVSPTVTTTYTMIAYDENGCTIEDEITIYVETNRSIYIPNGFSPNGDGINDNFMIFANVDLVDQVQIFEIYDRWGVEVFSLENFVPNDESFGWDGTYKDEILDPGVYTYYAVLLLTDGETSLLRGEVTIVR